MALKKNRSDLHLKFYNGLSLDKEVSIEFWKSSDSWSGVRIWIWTPRIWTEYAPIG